MAPFYLPDDSTSYEGFIFIDNLLRRVRQCADRGCWDRGELLDALQWRCHSAMWRAQQTQCLLELQRHRSDREPGPWCLGIYGML